MSSGITYKIWATTVKSIYFTYLMYYIAIRITETPKGKNMNIIYLLIIPSLRIRSKLEAFESGKRSVGRYRSEVILPGFQYVLNAVLGCGLKDTIILPMKLQATTLTSFISGLVSVCTSSSKTNLFVHYNKEKR